VNERRHLSLEPFMKLPLTCLAVAAALTACSSDSESGPLTGTWGGPSMSVSAASGAVTITLTCGAKIKVSHPIMLDASGRFSLVDSLRGNLGGGSPTDTIPGLSKIPIQAVEVDGQISGDVLSLTLTLDLTTGNITVPITFTATKGQPGTMNSYEVCRD
jgi:hypothetical protein